MSLKQAQESLQLATMGLLVSGIQGGNKREFYAHMLMQMRVSWNNPRIKTAAVSITDKMNFVIDSEFFNKLDILQQMELIEHEVEHLIYGHIPRAKAYLGDGKKSGHFKLANVAMDANINENKPNLTRDLGVTIDKLNKQMSEKGSKLQLVKGEPWEIHYEKLRQFAKDQPQSEDGGLDLGDDVDDHSDWGDSEVSQEIQDEIVRNSANKAQASTGAGNMPSSMLQAISDLNKASVDWRKELRRFFVNSVQYDYRRTRNRRNRRYGLLQPGRNKDILAHIAFILDSSGSVSDTSFSQFFAEMKEALKLGVKITVIDCDCAVAAVYELEANTEAKRFGGGGTSYQPGIDKAMELGVDGIAYLGDMDSSDVPVDPKVPFLWAVVGGQSPPANFGEVVRVLEQK